MSTSLSARPIAGATRIAPAPSSRTCRVTNRSECAWGYWHDGVRYDIESGQTIIVQKETADHLKFYADHSTEPKITLEIVDIPIYTGTEDDIRASLGIKHPVTGEVFPNAEAFMKAIQAEAEAKAIASDAPPASPAITGLPNAPRYAHLDIDALRDLAKAQGILSYHNKSREKLEAELDAKAAA